MGRRRASTSGRQVIPVRGLWLLHALWCGNSCTSTSVRLRTPSGTAHALQPGAAGVANGGARDASPIPDDATLLALSYSTHPFCAKPEAERPRQSVGPGRSGCERHCCAPAPVPPDQHASHSAEFSPGSRRHFFGALRSHASPDDPPLRQHYRTPWLPCTSRFQRPPARTRRAAASRRSGTRSSS